MMKIEFRPFQPLDLPLFRRWLSEPHVRPFWQETDNEEELYKKFFERFPKEEIQACVILLRGIDGSDLPRPIGYIQSYEACKIGGGWWPGVRAGVFGVDLLIGDLKFYARGWGAKVLLHFLEDLFSKYAVREVIIDPEPANARAIAAYEKVGFQKQEIIETPGGKAQLMILERQRFLQPSYSLRKLEAASISKVQNLFESTPQYHLAVEGRLAPPSLADEIFRSGPSDFDLQNKFSFGFFREGVLLGFVDLAKGYPAKDIAYLGLLLIDESLHGRGLGRLCFELVQREVKTWGCEKIRLSVAETNDVLGFWKKSGFTPTGRVLKPQQKEIVCNVIEMEKLLSV